MELWVGMSRISNYQQYQYYRQKEWFDFFGFFIPQYISYMYYILYIIMIYDMTFWKFEIHDDNNILMHNELFIGSSVRILTHIVRNDLIWQTKFNI